MIYKSTPEEEGKIIIKNKKFKLMPKRNNVYILNFNKFRGIETEWVFAFVTRKR